MVSDQTMRAGIKLIQRNAETVQHALQCGTRLAARLNERSADQCSRGIGFSVKVPERLRGHPRAMSKPSCSRAPC